MDHRRWVFIRPQKDYKSLQEFCSLAIIRIGMVQITINVALQIRHPIVMPSVVFGARNLSTRQTS